jgi:hypothetical protein
VAKKVNLSETEIQWILDKYYPASNPNNIDKIAEEFGAPIKQTDIERGYKKGDSRYSQDLAISVHTVWVQEQVKEMQIQNQQFLMRQENFRQMENSPSASSQDVQNFKNELSRDQFLLKQNENFMEQLQLQNKLLGLEHQKFSQLSTKRNTLLQGYSDLRTNLMKDYNSTFIESQQLSSKFNMTPSKQIELESEYINLAAKHIKKGKNLDSSSFQKDFDKVIMRVMSEGNPANAAPNASELRQFNQHKEAVCKSLTEKIKPVFDIRREIAAVDKELDTTHEKIGDIEKKLSALERQSEKIGEQFNRWGRLPTVNQSQTLEAGNSPKLSRGN